MIFNCSSLGRGFPTLIAISSFFIGGMIANAVLGGIISALTLTSIVLLGIISTFLVSKLLSVTLFKGMCSSFSLELPPYRRPQIKKILVRSALDRTVSVLGRAVSVAVPCGLLIWLLANINVNAQPLIYYLASFFEPLGKLMGMDGYILSAFFIGFPANEIVIPITVMSYTSAGALAETQSIAQLGGILAANGWTVFTGISVLLFCLFHFPCATTCLTIKKETKSLAWTALAFILPTVIGIIVCILFNFAINLFF